MFRYVCSFSVLLFSLCPAPAEARSRPSACVAPTQAITTDEEKAVETMVSAQAREVANGEASASGSTARSYATVLIDKGDVARLFAVYQWCMQREQGMITNEFYEQMVRQIQGSSTPTSQTQGSSSTTKKVAPDRSAVAGLPMEELRDWSWLEGTWNLTAKPDRNGTCGTTAPDEIYYIWSVAVTSGVVEVKAMVANPGDTETVFPHFEGFAAYPTMRVSGLEVDITTKVQDTYMVRESWFELTMEPDSGGGHLQGVRRVMSVKKINMANGAPGIVPCFSDWVVIATR